LQDWPLCANMLLLSVAGLALGRAQASLLSIPDRLQTPVVVMSALGNVGNLPLVLVPTIAANPAVGPLDSEEGLRYVLLTYFWACFMQFPLAYTLFGNAARQAQAQADVAVHMSQPPVLSPPAASAAVAAAAAPGGASPAAAGKQTLAAGAEASAYSSTGGLSRWGRAPTSSAVHGLSSSSSGSSRSNGISPHSSSISTSTSSSSNGAGSTSTSSSSSSQPQAASQPSEDWRLLARNVLNPPVMACIAAAAMGSQPALQHALFMPSGETTGVGCLHTGCGGCSE
jgi:predicted permease